MSHRPGRRARQWNSSTTIRDRAPRQQRHQEQMHKPAEFLFPLNIEKMPGRGPEIVAAFLSRLQGAPIGFTVYRLFTIDTSTILMVCGTILTYAVVIIQFQPGVGGTSALSAPSMDVIAATTPSPLAASADLIVALNSSTG